MSALLVLLLKSARNDKGNAKPRKTKNDHDAQDPRKRTLSSALGEAEAR